MSYEQRKQSAIAIELRQLAAAHNGELRPQVVVDAARAATSPLHDSFEWDDSTAAEQWRLAQARVLIRAVVTYEQVGQKSVPVRVFVSLSPDRKEDGVGYRLATDVLSDAEYRAQLLTDARADMQRFKAKYSRLTELAAVFEAMDNVRQEEPISATA